MRALTTTLGLLIALTACAAPPTSARRSIERRPARPQHDATQDESALLTSLGVTDFQGRGTILRRGATRWLVAGERDTPVMPLDVPPTTTCASRPSDSTPSHWWLFAGHQAVVMRLTPRQVTLWRFDHSKGCLQAWVPQALAALKPAAQPTLEHDITHDERLPSDMRLDVEFVPEADEAPQTLRRTVFTNALDPLKAKTSPQTEPADALFHLELGTRGLRLLSLSGAELARFSGDASGEIELRQPYGPSDALIYAAGLELVPAAAGSWYIDLMLTQHDAVADDIAVTTRYLLLWRGGNHPLELLERRRSSERYLRPSDERDTACCEEETLERAITQYVNFDGLTRLGLEGARRQIFQVEDRCDAGTDTCCVTQEREHYTTVAWVVEPPRGPAVTLARFQRLEHSDRQRRCN